MAAVNLVWVLGLAAAAAAQAQGLPQGDKKLKETIESTDNSISLEASFMAGESGDLMVHATLTNGSATEVLVYDRLWTPDPSRISVVDTQIVYRFIRNGQLRLLFGAPPLPRTRLVAFQNVPYVSRLQSRQSKEFHFTLPPPLSEYNFYYFPEDPSDEFEAETASEVELLVEYVKRDAEIQLIPSRFDPSAFAINEPGKYAPSLVRSKPVKLRLQVRRRVGEFERLTLPGEPEEPYVWEE